MHQKHSLYTFLVNKKKHFFRGSMLFLFDLYKQFITFCTVIFSTNNIYIYISRRSATSKKGKKEAKTKIKADSFFVGYLNYMLSIDDNFYGLPLGLAKLWWLLNVIHV